MTHAAGPSAVVRVPQGRAAASAKREEFFFDPAS